ncbi:MAG: hypothetical protein MUF87_02100 [Anaerolineae bacterium]|jgi:hypothetical protein|nr:hypothetical protein [Anaerolineae bacterium]
MNHKRYILVLTAIFVIVMLFVISGGRVIPPTMVNYYGQVITEDQVAIKSPNGMCISYRMYPLEALYVHWTYQASLICFDSMPEVDNWMRSQGLLD